MESSWLWHVNKTEEEVKRILADPADKSFVHYAALLLSRQRGLPKEIFREYLSKENFCRHWLAIRRKMRKDNWNDQRIPFWNEIFKYLVLEFKKKGVVFPRQKNEIRKSPAWKGAANGLRARRRAQKMTQAELARRMGVRQQFVSKIESGTQNLSLRTLERIEKALGASLYSYAAGAGRPSAGMIAEPLTTWLSQDPGIRTESK